MTTEFNIKDSNNLADILNYVNEHGYSDLSDEQINLIIEYRAKVYAEQQTLKNIADNAMAANEEMKQQTKDIADKMQQALDAALQVKANFESVAKNE